MKVIFKYLFLLSISISSAYASELVCQSSNVIDGWDGASTSDKLYLSAQIENENLQNPTIKGAFHASYDGTLKGIPSQNGKWLRFRTLEDAWCWFSVILPADFYTYSSIRSFNGFVDKICEEGLGKDSFRVRCSIK